ncbi:MAG TPA: hypothetical protein DCR55_17365 [Lentisphaeria bacterium]|nr:hypothetical protein [Lentisphaeria bacterium]
MESAAFYGSGGGSLTCAFCSGQVDFEAFARAGTVDSSIRSDGGQGREQMESVRCLGQRHFRYTRHELLWVLGVLPVGDVGRFFDAFRVGIHTTQMALQQYLANARYTAEVAIDLEGRMKVEQVEICSLAVHSYRDVMEHQMLLSDRSGENRAEASATQRKRLLLLSCFGRCFCRISVLQHIAFIGSGQHCADQGEVDSFLLNSEKS